MKTFSSHNLNLAYIDVSPGSSAGIPVLLIHGFASNHIVNWVNTLWIKILTEAGRRVVAFDNRGHGQSDTPHDPKLYDCALMADDARNLLDHLDISRADVMGYSMGGRIAARLAADRPERLRSLLIGGLGIRLIDAAGLPSGIADAMEAPSLEALHDPMHRMFRAFAQQTASDLKAMAACIRGSRQPMTREEVAGIAVPTLISIGSRDEVAGSAQELADVFPNARLLDIPGRDHNLAVGDKVHKQGVLAFLARNA